MNFIFKSTVFLQAILYQSLAILSFVKNLKTALLAILRIYPSDVIATTLFRINRNSPNEITELLVFRNEGLNGK